MSDVIELRDGLTYVADRGKHFFMLRPESGLSYHRDDGRIALMPEVWTWIDDCSPGVRATVEVYNDLRHQHAVLVLNDEGHAAFLAQFLTVH